MTLVAGLSVGGNPAFIGDLLVSWGLPTEIALPTRQAPGIFPGAHQNYACGLAQKLVIVRPYLLIAWAGSMSTIGRLVARLDDGLPLTIDGLKNDPVPILSALQECSEGVEVVALVFDGKTISPLCVHTRGFELDGRRIYLLGSGRDAFFKFTQWPDNTVPPADDRAGLTLRAVMLRFAAEAMLWQYGAGLGLSSSWGGGFEIAHATEAGFAKIDNILIRAWSVRGKEANSLGVSFLLHYEGADLRLTTFGEQEKTFSIPSMVPSSPRGKSRTVVIPEWTVDMFDVENGWRTFAAVQHDRPGSRGHARFSFRDGSLAAYAMRKERWDKILEQVLTQGEKKGFSIRSLDD